ncbi:hypothetical protein TNCV_1534361 [Trichonephila clavipes]|nr:hypothetical protein TNCV_1534361 [Trichonephila clavipes]
MTIPDFSPTKNVYTPQQWSSNCVPRNPGVPRYIPRGSTSHSGDRGRVAIYRPFGELRRAKIVLSPVWCSRPTTGLPLAHATMNFVGLDLTTSDRTWEVERRKFYDPVRSLLKSKNQEINRLQLAVNLPWANFIESVDILS